MSKIAPCEECNGTGFIHEEECVECNGTGLIHDDVEMDDDYPFDQEI